MKVTAIITGICALAIGLAMLLPAPGALQAEATPQVPTLVPGQR